jgi:cytochrome c
MKMHSKWSVLAVASIALLSQSAIAAQKTPVDDGLPSTLRPANYKPNYPSSHAAIRSGEKLFRSDKLSTNGRACSNCHADAGTFGPNFKKPYPHAAMNAQARFGVETLHLDEVIQVCLQGPLRATPLEWGSKEQADLVAYLTYVQKFGKMTPP